MTSELLLSLEDVRASYGPTPVLHGVSLTVRNGEVASLIGRNGAGKTTTLRAIMGIVTPTSGTIRFDGDDIVDLPEHRTTREGIRYVPEDRQIYPDLSVTENLQMGTLGGGNPLFTTEEVFERFPRLRERRGQNGSQLSGGEQQMLAIARALLSETELLLLDEPTEGLAPQIVADVLDIIETISDEGITVLLVEQNIQAALTVAENHHIIDRGEIVYEGTSDELTNDERVQQRYLGVASTDALGEE